MIKIKIKQAESDCLIEVHGHAGYAPKGSDIVCSAISVLYQTMVLTFEKDKTCRCEHIRSNDGLEHVRLYDMQREGIGTLQSFIYGCEEIATAYPDYVNVDDELT